jgi:hypothetical protein
MASEIGVDFVIGILTHKVPCNLLTEFVCGDYHARNVSVFISDSGLTCGTGANQ